jgi:hypothetical protein
MNKIGNHISDVEKYLKDIEDNKKKEAINKLAEGEKSFQK